MGKLGVIRPTDVPHATEYVQSMVDMINTLVTADKAYVTDDGVYLSIASVPDYGLLAHQSLDDMLSGGGDREVFGASNKRHPSDFALWKFSKPGEPSWPSPWGEGRPGWHSECVVMSLDLLGEGFDLHCGGADLRFPHHENERAQAVALGKNFANHWMHNGFVVDIEGEKMSKSLGNVMNLIDMLEKYDPRAYRMLLLQTHYRSPTRVGQENIDACVSALAGLDSFAARTVAHSNGTPDSTLISQFTSAMDNDLDTTTVMALVFDSVRRANTAMDTGDASTVSSVRAAVIEILGALGLELSLGDDIDAEIVAKGAALDAARTAKDFAAADALRDELQSLGYVVETSKDGTRIRRG
jgi:cysteinyl-tRNA synthetase